MVRVGSVNWWSFWSRGFTTRRLRSGHGLNAKWRRGETSPPTAQIGLICTLFSLFKWKLKVWTSAFFSRRQRTQGDGVFPDTLLTAYRDAGGEVGLSGPLRWLTHFSWKSKELKNLGTIDIYRISPGFHQDAPFLSSSTCTYIQTDTDVRLGCSAHTTGSYSTKPAWQLLGEMSLIKVLVRLPLRPLRPQCRVLKLCV